jgi:O-succinylbenzoate synthase
MTEREGIILRLEEPTTGRVGLGEVAPLPEFGTETADEAEAAMRKIGPRVTAEQLAAMAERLGCVQFALAGAMSELEGPTVDVGEKSLPVAALLPAGRSALEVVKTKGEAGFRTFKWKVGVAAADEELPLFDDVCAELPKGARLRLDANGAWDRRTAERWLERCAERPVEFVEQPVARAARGAEDLLRGLAEDWPTKIALDESLVGAEDLEHWINAGWSGIFVVKLALLGDPAKVLARLRAAQADVVFSAALATAVGARAALRGAFAPQAARGEKAEGRGEKGGVEKPPRALGFGVWPLFADARFDGPFAVPFLRARDVEALNVEAVWNALS